MRYARRKQQAHPYNGAPAAVPCSTPSSRAGDASAPAPPALPLSPAVLVSLKANIELLQELPHRLSPCAVRARIRLKAHLICLPGDAIDAVSPPAHPTAGYLVSLAAWCLIAVDYGVFDSPPDPDGQALAS